MLCFRFYRTFVGCLFHAVVLFFFRIIFLCALQAAFFGALCVGAFKAAFKAAPREDSRRVGVRGYGFSRERVNKRNITAPQRRLAAAVAAAVFFIAEERQLS